MTIHEIMEEVEQDRVFYRHGGGGLTVSGGEPLSHGTFTVNLLREARERYLSTAIETSGAVETEVLLDAANYLDCIYYDVKSVNASRHELWTGCSNEKILRNLEALLEYCRGMDDPPEVIVRTPVIPGFNDTRQDILAICDYLQSIGQTRHELLRYHRYGQSKYEKLGRQYLMGDAVLDDAAWQELTMLHSQLF
jgi:pyruvate formate lyase activating enzyme